MKSKKLSIFILVIALGVVVSSSILTSVTGAKLSSLVSKNQVISSENDILLEQIEKTSSLSQISKQAADAGFISPVTMFVSSFGSLASR